MKSNLTITQAIELAKQNKTEGFDFLYNSTYKEKYYLALKYMKNEDLAQDVLQDAYIKAFKNLGKLNDAEKFSAWLGTIVINTAKNALVKKKTTLFSELDSDDFSEGFENLIEDERVSNQPEIAISAKETQELVHHMLDNLSEDQKICILAFYIENLSIKEIASSLDCSENTVKSRLHQARAKIKTRGEELQKKGYSLYGMAPLPLLLLLLKNQQINPLINTALTQIGTNIVKEVVTSSATEVAKNSASSIASNTISETVKTGVFQTITGKVIAGVVATVIIGSAALFIAPQNEETDVPDELNTVISDDTINEEPSGVVLADGDYSSLIAGNLTKDELEFIFGYGVPYDSEGNFYGQDTVNIDEHMFSYLNSLSENYFKVDGLPGFDPATEENAYYLFNYNEGYPLAEINRLLQSFTAYQITADKDIEAPVPIEINGNFLTFYGVSDGRWYDVTIDKAEYTDEEMVIHFTQVFTKMAQGGNEISPVITKKKATLHPIENGLFRISAVVLDDSEEESSEQVVTEMQNSDEYMDLYKNALSSVENKESGFTFEFSEFQQPTGIYEYFLYDIDGNGIKELFVGAEITNDVFLENQTRIYTCIQSGNEYSLKPILGETYIGNARIPADGEGLLDSSVGRMNGQVTVVRLTVSNGELAVNNVTELDHTINSDEATSYMEQNIDVEWFDISDQSGLN